MKQKDRLLREGFKIPSTIAANVRKNCILKTQQFPLLKDAGDHANEGISKLDRTKAAQALKICRDIHRHS